MKIVLILWQGCQMDKINKGEAITEGEGKLVVDFIDQTMKDPEFIIKTFKKEPRQVEKSDLGILLKTTDPYSHHSRLVDSIPIS